MYEKPIRIELKGTELFVDGKQHPKDVRTLSQMREVLQGKLDPKLEFDSYYMFRNVYRNQDIRFDITVIPVQELGEEYAKTYGHYHPKSEDGKEYPEIYQVLQGNALFILQKRRSNDTVDVSIVKAKKGDVTLIPPGYGHVTVNPSSEETLVLANLIYDKFSSLYDEYKTNKGAAYYYLRGGEIAQNGNYLVHQNERIGPDELNKRYDFSSADILQELQDNPSKFEFLKKPGMLSKFED